MEKFSILLSLSLFPLLSAHSADNPKKNVIFILCDDMGYGDLGCYGQKYIKTPNLDRMASEGIQFMQHYSGCPVSAPSRCSIQTGLHTGHSQIRGNKEIKPEGQESMAEDTYTIARLMKNAGYVTGIFGKWGLGAPGSSSTPNKMGYDQFFGYICQRQAHTYYPNHLWKNENRYELPENRNKGHKIYSQDLIHKKAMEFIKANKDKPFFAMLTYTIPHAELNLPHDDIYKMYENSFEETPYISKVGYREGSGGYDTSMKPRASFAAMITRLDKYVGEIMEQLKEMGIDDNTVVFFTSDNGPHDEGGADPAFFNSAGPLRGIKRDVYEGGIRVPMLAWCPGMIPSGQKTWHISAFWDLMPTLADITGTRIGAYTDGISYLPTLLGSGKQKTHKFLYWEFHESNGRQAVRVGKWKLIRQPINGDTKVELYNLDNDIHEDHNLAVMYPNVVAELITIMDNARTESDIFNFGRKNLTKSIH